MSVKNKRRPITGISIVLAVSFISTGALAQANAPAADCSVLPKEVIVGEPVIATVRANNFNPRHTLTYVWSPSTGGGKVIATDTIARIETANAAPGSYTVTAFVTDAKERKNNEVSCSADFIIKPAPRNPPTLSVSASPMSVPAGETVNLSANCTSPDGVPVSVADWKASGGTVSSAGAAATLNTAGASPGSITVSATCIDARGLTGRDGIPSVSDIKMHVEGKFPNRQVRVEYDILRVKPRD